MNRIGQVACTCDGISRRLEREKPSSSAQRDSGVISSDRFKSTVSTFKSVDSIDVWQEVTASFWCINLGVQSSLAKPTPPETLTSSPKMRLIQCGQTYCLRNFHIVAKDKVNLHTQVEVGASPISHNRCQLPSAVGTTTPSVSMHGQFHVPYVQ